MCSSRSISWFTLLHQYSVHLHCRNTQACDKIIRSDVLKDLNGGAAWTAEQWVGMDRPSELWQWSDSRTFIFFAPENQTVCILHIIAGVHI